MLCAAIHGAAVHHVARSVDRGDCEPFGSGLVAARVRRFEAACWLGSGVFAVPDRVLVVLRYQVGRLSPTEGLARPAEDRYQGLDVPLADVGGREGRLAA